MGGTHRCSKFLRGTVLALPNSAFQYHTTRSLGYYSRRYRLRQYRVSNIFLHQDNCSSTYRPHPVKLHPPSLLYLHHLAEVFPYPYPLADTLVLSPPLSEPLESAVPHPRRDRHPSHPRLLSGQSDQYWQCQALSLSIVTAPSLGHNRMGSSAESLSPPKTRCCIPLRQDMLISV